MPWVDEEKCTGCMTCYERCPAGAIEPARHAVCIVDADCIRCGVCHEVCPVGAVRHDGERIPSVVEDNMAWVKKIASHDHFSDGPMTDALLERLKRHFNGRKKIAEQTLLRIETLQKEWSSP